MERLVSGSKADISFLSFKNTQRETGEVLVEGAGTMQLTATEAGSRKRMDVKETNAYLRSLAHFSPQAAFRYHKQPNEASTLALEWVRYPDSSLLAAVAEHAGRRVAGVLPVAIDVPRAGTSPLRQAAGARRGNESDVRL